MNRRKFLSATATALTTTALSNIPTIAAGPNWPVGCFNRPWTKWGGIDIALDGIKEAGFNVMGLLTRTRTEPLIESLQSA